MRIATTLILIGTLLSASLPAADKPKKAGATPSDKKESGAAGMRTWTDKTGKFKVKAKFVEVKKGKVALETSDGKTVLLELEKLSKEDQKIALNLAKEAGNNASQAEDENPFDAGVQKKSSAASQDRVEPELTATDWVRVKAIVPDANAGWSLKPDPGPALDKPLAAKPIVLISAAGKGEPPTLGPFEQVEALLFDRAKGRACAVIRDAPPGKPPRNRVQRVDLVAGQADEPIEFPSVTMPDDVDAAVGLVVAKSNQHLPGHPEPTVGVWKFGKDDFTHVRSWNTVEAGDFFKAHPGQAKILDADHILTLSFPNKLVVWQVSKARAVYKMDVGHAVALSGNRKYLASALPGGLYFFDPLTGKTLGKLPCGPGPGVLDAIAFSPDGKQLAGASERRFMAWDLDKGELTHDVLFPQSMIHKNVDWIGKSHVLLGGERVFDLEKRAVVWRYQNEFGQPYSRGCGETGGSFWYTLKGQGDKECNLYRAQLPHDEALKAAAALDAASLLAIRPQAAVALNVNVQGTPEEQQQLKQALEKELQALGMTIAGGSPVVVQAETEPGKTKEISYQGFGLGKKNTATVTEQICRLKIVDGGKTIWESVSVSESAPPILQLKEGQSLQEALVKYQKPNLKLFSTFKLPQYITRSLDPPGGGTSRLTAQGVQAAQPRAGKSGARGR